MNRDALTWCLGVVAAIAVAAVVALVARNRALERKKKQDESEHVRRLGEATRQLESTKAELDKYQHELDGTLREAGEAAEENTKAVLKGAARFLQSLAAEQMALLEEVQRKYGGHAVLTDLGEVTHANAQMARKAQGIAVMCGAPIGRRSRPATVYDVVRSAQGQIRNFGRVEIWQQTGFMLKSTAVSPVALAVAELLDNAASFSQGDAPIEVTFKQYQSNLCIVIDDAGVGMNDEERQKAATLLDGGFVPRLSQLGTQPKFGFPVIGLLARQYGFRVDVSGVSRYGGVRAVVLVPEELWAQEQVQPVTPAEETAASPSDAHPAEDRPQRIARTAHGLPKRGARQTPVVGAPESEGPLSGLPAQQEEGRASTRGLGAFQRGTLSGRDLAPSTEGSEDA